MKRVPLTWMELRPRDATADQVLATTRLLAIAAGTPTVLEAIGASTGVVHRVATPNGHATHLADQLRSTFPD